MISIVLPLYNIAKHMPSYRACLRSILKQSYTNWELLLVNDGSTDGTHEIIEKAVRSDARIKALHKEHAGVEAARNYGLNHAMGQFITFVDQDDMLHPEALMLMRKAIVEDDSDIAIVNYRRFIFSTRITIPVTITPSMSKRRVIPRDEYMQKHYQMFFGINDLPINIWGKLYRTSLLRQYGNLEPSLYGVEDLYFNMCILPHARRISIVPDQLYLYRWGGWTTKPNDQLLHVGLTGYNLKKRQIDALNLPVYFRLTSAIELLNYSLSHLGSISEYRHLDESGIRDETDYVLSLPDIQEAIRIVKEDGKYHTLLTDYLLAQDSESIAREICHDMKRRRPQRIIKRILLFLTNLTS